jgi:putative transcriptional regulator
MARRLSLVLLAALICLVQALAQTTPIDPLTPGTIVVASEKLTDPHFAYTVVLITRHEPNGEIMGVILNRPMDLSIAKAFPQMHGSNDPVFDGGPVSEEAVQALLRTSDKPDTAQHILADVYSVARKALLEKSINDKIPVSKFRVYLGYAGWGPSQLENELRLGAWTVVHGSKYIFDAKPSTLWDRLNAETHSLLALNRTLR